MCCQFFDLYIYNIKMGYNHKLNTVIQIILIIFSIAYSSPTTFITTIILNYIPYPILTLLISLLSVLVSTTQIINIYKLITMASILTAYVLTKNNRVADINAQIQFNIYWLSSKHILPIFFICFSLISITNINIIRTIFLLSLFLMLLLSAIKYKYLSYLVELCCVVCGLWSIYSYLQLYCKVNWMPIHVLNTQQPQQWWYYVGAMLSIMLGRVYVYITYAEQERHHHNHHRPSQLIQQSRQVIQIQMKDMSVHEQQLKQEVHIEEEVHNKNEQKQSSQPSQQLQVSQLIKKEEEYKSQGQILNVFLLIPFILYSYKPIQIPIYLYIIPLQFSCAPTFTYYLMLLSVFIITFLQQTHALHTQLIIRVCMILIINKNIQLAINITKIVKSLILRTSFILVLGILFWFALKTVNLFHIFFIILLLLFITRNSKSQTNERSFRNRNWKYLLLLFQVFLLLRYVFSVLTQLKIPLQLNMILSLVGIDYWYTDNHFNAIPFFISGIIGIQYWIYSSHIYNIQSKKQIQFTYRGAFQKILNILTICYYKIIPWSSHLLLLIILLSLQFSITSGIILLWTLAILLTHMINPNNASTYERLYSMWLMCSRLIAFQIILRYVFQFMKLPIISDNVSMATLLKYQQLLGLVIRQSQNSYFKNIFTKFQLMIALDFILIAITFLALQYYHILIKYETANQLPQNEYKLINQTYNKYINFKLTQWLRNFNEMLVMFAGVFIKIYYPIIGVYSSLHYSYSSLVYLTICVVYYLYINTHYYHIYILSKIQHKIGDIFQKWRKMHNKHNIQHIILSNSQSSSDHQQDNPKQFEEQVKAIKHKLCAQIPISSKQNKLNIHGKLRFLVVSVTLLFVVMNYSSRILQSQQIVDMVSEEQVRRWRWYMLIMGTSYQSNIDIGVYFIIIIMTIIQIKCCSLLSKTKPQQQQMQQQQSQGQSQQQKYKQQHKQLQLLQRQKDKEQQLHLWQQQHQYQQQEQQINNKQQIPIYNQEQESDKFVDMQVSFRLGINKIVQRGFVILLVFVSILQDNNPFSIIYLSCAWLLNYMGNNSIQTLSIMLSILIILQYSLFLTDTNINDQYTRQFPQFVSDSWLINILHIQSPQWKQYLRFGDTFYELLVIFISLVILMSYQLCFVIERYSWQKVLHRLKTGIKLGRIQLRIYKYLCKIYEYALVYSPLCITTLCLALYLMDYTATNMFLAILSVLFLFKSFLLQNYTTSRPFWKSYFRILQLLIVFFMVVYCVLKTPMYKSYCNPLLCSAQEFSTKVTKTILLLILQVGIDLISSRHFITAMNTLKVSLDSISPYYRLAISYMQNDRKIRRKFRLFNKKAKIKQNMQNVSKFLQELKKDNSLKFDNEKNKISQKQSWLDTVLELLPSLVDDQLIMTPQKCKVYVKKSNEVFIKWLSEKERQIQEQEQQSPIQLRQINQLYKDTFGQLSTEEQVRNKIAQILKTNYNNNKGYKQRQMFQTPEKSEKQLRRCMTEQIRQQQLEQMMYRKSFIDDIFPFDDRQVCRTIIQKEIISNRKGSPSHYNHKQEKRTVQDYISLVDKEEKKKLLYLLILQSIFSNWHYLTYLLMILEFIFNMGLLTLSFPFIVFIYGLTYTYQAPKWVWRSAFVSVLLPMFFKFSVSIGLFKIQGYVQFILIGDNIDSILIQYLLIFFILVQCLILKIVGLYDYSTPQVQCMKMALIRNIINISTNKNIEQEQKTKLYMLLQESQEMSITYFQFMFSKKECKSGFDYSTLMVTIQLTILIYIFCFYDRMAIQNELTFYQMIQYNQFTTGMVIMAFIQLIFILVQRILSVVQFSQRKWNITLIIKFFVLLISFTLVHLITIFFFPFTSDNFQSNTYVTVFYILHAFYFLISALQIRFGMEKESKGFMDRYTWYNGFIYMAYRAVPFLFQFKVFSDWTFTNTSLRLFDWIKFEQIFGRLYVAKCNSLFLQGKVLGSKIEWWKKLSMGFPLLFAIILLLFGPLILFSNLNPLAAVNQVSGGYLQLSLKVNKTNKYIFYTNSHITDIHFISEKDHQSQQIQQIVKDYELDPKSIQQIYLQEFSDKYWQISQGSYSRLMNQPLDSLYELRMKIKFQRNLTGATPVYMLNKREIPKQKIQDFKKTLLGQQSFEIQDFFPSFLRLDNNNGLHELGQKMISIKFHAEEGKRRKKMYWVINEGIKFRLVSDKYSKAIFGYSVMSFYISIILVVANYFRFLFQGSAHTIIMSDIPYADSMLVICNAIHQARIRNDLKEEQILYWTMIDIVRSPDTIKALTGNYLQARLQTLKQKQD